MTESTNTGAGRAPAAMRVLVAYATRHGSTRGIAEWIAAALRAADLEVTLTSVTEPIDLGAHDAYVIGSAAYMGRWLQAAAEFVRDHRTELAGRPVWLFSSGPTGDARVDAKGNDIVEASRPLEFDEFAESVRPRDEAVFYGAWEADTKPIGLVEALGVAFLRLPGIRKALPTGDFRDRTAVEAWATDIARQLQAMDGVEPLAAPA